MLRSVPGLKFFLNKIIFKELLSHFQIDSHIGFIKNVYWSLHSGKVLPALFMTFSIFFQEND